MGRRFLNNDVTALDARAVDRHARRLVLDASSRDKAEVLLVDRRCDDELALQVAHDSAREHVRARVRVVVVDRVDAVVLEAEHRDLAVAHQRAYPGVGDDVVQAANGDPAVTTLR